MKALILNSGLGSRMGDLTHDHPKCMTPITKEDTIVSRQLKILSKAGIKEVVYLSDKYADTPNTKASKRMLHSANVKLRQFNSEIDAITIGLSSQNC